MVRMYGINNYMCFKHKNMSVEGNFYSDDFKYIEIKLYKCQSNCKNRSVIDSTMD